MRPGSFLAIFWPFFGRSSTGNCPFFVTAHFLEFGAKPNHTHPGPKPSQASPNQANPGCTWPNQPKPCQTSPNHAKKPSQTSPNHPKPSQPSLAQMRADFLPFLGRSSTGNCPFSDTADFLDLLSQMAPNGARFVLGHLLAILWPILNGKLSILCHRSFFGIWVQTKPSQAKPGQATPNHAAVPRYGGHSVARDSGGMVPQAHAEGKN